jgi:hypothetical protein
MFKKVAILFLAVFLFTPFVYAYKRAPFPNSNSLQPLPVFAHPNVSGNVNSGGSVDTTQVAQDGSIDITTDAEQSADAAPSSQQDQTPPAPAFSFNVVYILLFLAPTLLIAAGALALKKRADKNNLM